MYLGSGWVGETWRGLRDELTLAPLFGERWGGTLARTLAWPVVAVTIGAFLGGGFAVVVRWDHHSGHLGDTAILVTGSVVMALGARFLREMKLDLPLELLLPVITPFGDLSGLRFVAWQFDGFVVVLVGVALMAALPSAVGATALAVCMAAGCVWTGLRRTGWAHRGSSPASAGCSSRQGLRRPCHRVSSGARAYSSEKSPSRAPWSRSSCSVAGRDVPVPAPVALVVQCGVVTGNATERQRGATYHFVERVVPRRHRGLASPSAIPRTRCMVTGGGAGRPGGSREPGQSPFSAGSRIGTHST